MEAVTSIGTILALAFLAESLTEYLFSRLLVNLGISKDYLRYVAAVVGVALAVAYEVDILEEFLDVGTDYPVVGEVFTGLLLGRGANFAHDFYSRLLSLKKGREDSEKLHRP
ncbi:MAG: hypothetical protein ACE5JL_04375 [Dehalococcoidia bacterium]